MDAKTIAALLRSIPGISKLLATFSKTRKLELAFRYEPVLFPPCHQRVFKEGRGFKWAHQIACHGDANGNLKITRLEAPKRLDATKPVKALPARTKRHRKKR